MDRITRKELKKDKFAQEVGHTVEFLGAHRKQFVRYGAIAAAVIVLVAGLFYYNHRQYLARQGALRSALTAMDAPVGPSPAPGIVTYSSAEEKSRAVSKALTDLAAKYAGSDEAAVARLYLSSLTLEQGKVDEAVKGLTEVAGSGRTEYASLAKFSLAEMYASQGKTAEAEKLLRELMDRPTMLVSKEQATLVLARLIAPTRPEEARKLLEPLRSAPGAVGRAAMSIYGDLFVKR
ncbi:MAG TPA: tetratricopeptide repeat protein [Bryobacteraceae bacterium]|nr:tetratricopeptide repeat protein [Bryobacteraceae bacterium]